MEFRYAIVFKETGRYKDGTPYNTVHTVHNKKELLELWSELIIMHSGHSYSVEDLNRGLTILSGKMCPNDFKTLEKLPEASTEPVMDCSGGACKIHFPDESRQQGEK